MLRDTTHDMPRLYDVVPAFYHSGVVYIVYVALRGSYFKAY